MPETAADRIQRLFQLITLAGRDGGMTFDQLARDLDVDRDQVQRDIAELTARDEDDLQIIIEGDTVSIWSTGPLKRPTRLNAGEAAALDLGLRILAAERGDDALPDAMRGLLEKLAWAVPDDVATRFISDGDPDTARDQRTLLIDAARARRTVRFRYLKPGADAPEDRTVQPYAVAHGEGHWYVVGHCPERDDIRIFRTDRILEATIGDAAFDPPAAFDVADYVTNGRVYQADDEIEVTVRYGGRVAPWLLERGEGEPLSDGGVLVRHRVSDVGWIVRHVLKYGRDARVVEPEGVRRAVAEAVGWVVR